MSDDLDTRYTTHREHADAQMRINQEIARLSERQATIEARLLHEMAAVRSVVDEIKVLIMRPPAQAPDHTALATHRALDTLVEVLERLGAQPRNGQNPFLLWLAIAGAIAIGVLTARLIWG